MFVKCTHLKPYLSTLSSVLTKSMRYLFKVNYEYTYEKTVSRGTRTSISNLHTVFVICSN